MNVIIERKKRGCHGHTRNYCYQGKKEKKSRDSLTTSIMYLLMTFCRSDESVKVDHLIVWKTRLQWRESFIFNQERLWKVNIIERRKEIRIFSTIEITSVQYVPWSFCSWSRICCIGQEIIDQSHVHVLKYKLKPCYLYENLSLMI